MTTSTGSVVPRPPKVPRPTPAPLTESPAVRRFSADLRDAPDDLARTMLIRRFWASAARTPLLEPSGVPGHHVVTFLWREPPGRPSAHVYLFVNRLTDERNLPRSRMALVPGTDVRHLSYLMPDEWRASYCFCPVADGDPDALTTADQPTLRRRLDGGEPDPTNPERCTGRGGRPMSVVTLPAAPAQEWLAPRSGIPRGVVRRVEMTAAPGWSARTCWVYEPPAGGPPDPPAVVLLDGDVWLNRIGITTTFDNLITAGRIPPIRVLLPDSLDTAVRWRELTARPKSIDALADHVLPQAGVESGTRAIVAGNSLGGLTAIAAVLRRPDRFGHAISMSGSVWWGPDEHGAPLLRRMAVADSGASPGIGVELQVGRQEWVLTEPTRELAAALRRPGRRVQLVEYQGGHDFAWWRGSLADALIRWADTRAAGGPREAR